MWLLAEYLPTYRQKNIQIDRHLVIYRSHLMDLKSILVLVNLPLAIEFGPFIDKVINFSFNNCWI